MHQLDQGVCFFLAKVDVCVCVTKVNIGKCVMQVSNEGGVVRETIPINRAQKHVINAS
jgi:hypothetical protein